MSPSPSISTTAQQASVFDGLVEYHQMSFDLLNRGEPDNVSTGVVSHNFFDVLGIKPHASAARSSPPTMCLAPRRCWC